MTQYVYWLSDIWGWSATDGDMTADLEREMEVGHRVTGFARWENVNPASYFSALAYELEVKIR